MSKTAIRTNVKKFFHPADTGYIRTKVEFVIIRPEQEKYELKLVDECFDYVEVQESIPYKERNEQGEEVTKYREISTTQERLLNKLDRGIKSYSYAELDMIGKLTGLNRADFTSDTAYINRLIQVGILAVTKKECREGIAGKRGVGMFGTKEDEWILE